MTSCRRVTFRAPVVFDGPATIETDTEFYSDVHFNAPVIFMEPVYFSKKVVFNASVTFNAKAEFNWKIIVNPLVTFNRSAIFNEAVVFRSQESFDEYATFGDGAGDVSPVPPLWQPDTEPDEQSMEGPDEQSMEGPDERSMEEPDERLGERSDEDALGEMMDDSPNLSTISSLSGLYSGLPEPIVPVARAASARPPPPPLRVSTLAPDDIMMALSSSPMGPLTPPASSRDPACSGLFVVAPGAAAASPSAFTPTGSRLSGLCRVSAARIDSGPPPVARVAKRPAEHELVNQRVLKKRAPVGSACLC